MIRSRQNRRSANRPARRAPQPFRPEGTRRTTFYPRGRVEHCRVLNTGQIVDRQTFATRAAYEAWCGVVGLEPVRR